MISTYVGENATFEKQFLDKELEVEFNPQGTLAERIRAGGAGIPAFYTATGVGTMVAEGKTVRDWLRPADDTKHFNRPPRMATHPGADMDESVRVGAPPRRPYVLETGLYADLALVKASTADPFGNLIYNKTARNFNPMMATAATFTIAEVDELAGSPSTPTPSTPRATTSTASSGPSARSGSSSGRSGEVLETIKGVRTTLDAAPADERVLGELQREARAEFVNEVERRVLKYGVQEFAISGIGILLTIAGLVGAARSSRENAGDGADDEPGGAEGA
jgi:acyl CoA:acetate/3-ketoacid CoA transferase alpha subunit